MPTTTETTILRGGEWLIQPSQADSVFTPERLTEEHRLIARTAQEFVDNEVLPKLDQLETKDWALSRELVKLGAGLGLLGVDVPEAYGGLGLDKVTSLVVSEKLARAASFGATFGAHATDGKLWVSSTKSMMGHLLGAAGAVEAAIAVLAIARSVVPPTINLTDPDPECPLDYVANRSRERRIKHAMSNSFGFGGTNATLVFSAFDG